MTVLCFWLFNSNAGKLAPMVCAENYTSQTEGEHPVVNAFRSHMQESHLGVAYYLNACLGASEPISLQAFSDALPSIHQRLG